MKTQTLSFLAMAVLAVVGCSKEGDTPSSGVSVFGGMSYEQKLKAYTEGDWLHDIDEARAVNEWFQRKSDDDGLNAFRIYHAESLIRSAFEFGSPLIECWPGASRNRELVTTANTDHDCLDKQGYTRSR
ncbi:MAG: hypothetical protein LBI31_03710 [Zoogloeaceae bacterium]|jgi:hypothetical protein|nr:hypothetical protein [Zoogloeaceae bacterium]